MNPSFLETLQSEGSCFADIAAVSTKSILPCFGDLIWPQDKPDPRLMNDDPGVEFINEHMTFVLMRVDGQIRYYAGPMASNNVDEEFEIGVFPSASAALSFGYDYLVSKRSLAAIKVKRDVRFPTNIQGQSTAD